MKEGQGGQRGTHGHSRMKSTMIIQLNGKIHYFHSIVLNSGREIYGFIKGTLAPLPLL